MSFVEVTSTGWGERIGDSLKGIIFGAIMIPVGVILLVWNERNAIHDIKANKEIAAMVASVPNTEVDDAKDGALVHVNGRATTEDIVENKKFGVSETAIRLSWKAQIYQWVEESETETKKKVGGGEEQVTTYTYHQRWVDAPVDSKDFKHKAGHENPKGSRKFKSGSDQAGKVTVGVFTLPRGLVSKITKSEGYPLQTLPEDLQEEGSIVDNGIFFTGSSFGSPDVGDEKVEFSIVRPRDVSVMAVQSGDSFKPYETKVGKKRFLLSEGLLTAEEMVQQEERKAAMLRWILRAGGILLIFIGFGMVLRPLSVLADIVPIFGSLVGGVTGLISLMLALGIGFFAIAISWVFFRPMLGIPLLIGAVACLAFVIVKVVQAKRNAASPPPPPPQMA